MSIIIGTPTFYKVQQIIGNTRLESEIKKLSSNAQTSCLEGFHATLNHWHPKMLCFFMVGILLQASYILCDKPVTVLVSPV